MEFLAGIAQAFENGGWLMWVILAVQVATIIIAVERSIFLFKKRSIGQKKLIETYEKDIRTGHLDEAKAKAAATSEPVGPVVAAGIEAAQNWGGKEEIRGKMDEVLLDINAEYESRTGFLAMLANVATLTGLLGTVTGMIKSFAAVSTASPVEKAVLLSAGISEVMVTTAYGLIVAIPALVVYAILSNRATKLAEDLNQASLKVFNWLSYSYDPAQRAVDIDVPKKAKAAPADL